jgi:hypothetical protein
MNVASRHEDRLGAALAKRLPERSTEARAR